ncbi:alpha/beta-hydrolase [Sparassis latifolia]
MSSHDTTLLPSGTTIEYALSRPPVSASSVSSVEGDSEPAESKLAICLHPWSRLGGRMDDPILHILVGPLLERGYHVLRYNSRGVGRSSGWASLTGSREAQDLKEVVQWALSVVPAVVSLVVMGYSYGSLIASVLPVLPNVKTSHVLLSYPLGPRHWLTAFRGKAYTSALQALIQDPHSNVLILFGDDDEFTDSESYETWSKSLLEVSGANGVERRLKVVKIDGATHFWREGDAARRLMDIVEKWLP